MHRDPTNGKSLKAPYIREATKNLLASRPAERFTVGAFLFRVFVVSVLAASVFAQIQHIFQMTESSVCYKDRNAEFFLFCIYAEYFLT